MENKTLLSQGFNPIVLALHEKGLLEKEVVGDVSVHRIRLHTRSWPKRKGVQLIKYLEFAVRVVKDYGKRDIFHCNDLGTLPIGAFIKRFVNSEAKVIYDAHEYETELFGKSRFENRLYKFVEKQLLGYADEVFCVSNSIADEYVRLYGIEKPKLVLNTPPYAEVVKQDLFRKAFDIGKDKTIFLYQGGLSRGRGVEILLDTFKENLSEGSLNNAVLVLMGFGPLQSLVQESADRCSRIFYHKAVPQDVLLQYTSSADYGILFYENTCLNHYYCSPNKMFEYLMAELPVIVSNLYEMKKIVEKNNVGIVAESNSVEGLQNAVSQIMSLDVDTLLVNIKETKLQYNWENQAKVLLQAYRRTTQAAE